jgi:hypothetical protein
VIDLVKVVSVMTIHMQTLPYTKCIFNSRQTCRLTGRKKKSDLKSLSIALRVRWPWLKKSEPNKPWASLPLQVSKDAECLLSLAIITEIGDGANTLFWKDKWLAGKSIQDLAPNLYVLVPKGRASRRTVKTALDEMKWTEDIQGEIPVQTLMEYLELWDMLEDISVQEGIPDRHIWRLSASGKYTAKSAYDALFEGALSFAPFERIWKSWAPPKCRFFMWLVAHNRCWTADRLALLEDSQTGLD